MKSQILSLMMPLQDQTLKEYITRLNFQRKAS